MSKPVVAVIAMGAMGAAVGARLAANGMNVVTSLAGRSAASRDRAASAGVRDVADAGIAAARIILSILPPGDAVALAERLAPALAAAGGKPLYIDCNAVSSATVARIGTIVAATGAGFADGGIIGGPPRAGYDGPTLYVSGVDASRVALLAEGGLQIKVLAGPVGAASALKMSYAAITKGLTAIASASILAAESHGAAAALRAELAQSQPTLLKMLDTSIPGMFAKAYRFDGEMQEIAEHAGRDSTARIYGGMAAFYRELAGKDGRLDVAALAAFCRSAKA